MDKLAFLNIWVHDWKFALSNLLFQKRLFGVVVFLSLISEEPWIFFPYGALSVVRIEEILNFYFGEKNHFVNGIQTEHGCPPPGGRSEAVYPCSMASGCRGPFHPPFPPPIQGIPHSHLLWHFLALAYSRKLKWRVGHFLPKSSLWKALIWMSVTEREGLQL